MKRILLALAIAATFTVSNPAQAQQEKPQCPKYHQLMRKHGLPPRHFSYIAWRESRCIPKAVNWNMRKTMTHRDCKDSGKYHARRKCVAVKSWDTGLLQINSFWDPWVKRICGASARSRILMNPSCNVRVAAAIYAEYGLEPWKGNSNG